MLPKEVKHIGDGLIEVVQEDFLSKILVQGELSSQYDVEKDPFARGNFGTVRRVTHKVTGVKYAAKFLRRRRRALCWAKQINHEIAVLMLSAESDQIVRLHAVFETRSEIALILELAAGGELQAILDEDGLLAENKTRTCIREVLKALEFLHRRHVAHLDIKPQNILLNTNNLEDGLKLCDFGFSRAVQGGNVCEIQGTPDYVAPEVLQYEPLCLNTDIWSVGVLAYVLLTGYSPFGGDTKQETFLNISKCNLTFPEELFEDISDDAIDFIKSVLRIKPYERLDVFECLDHKWLNEDTLPTILTLQPTTQLSSVENISPNTPSTPSTPSKDQIVLSTPTSTPVLKVSEELEKTQKVSILEILEDKENQLTIKSVLEKSSSLSLFPDAPTTPKVCRKAPYDESLSTQVVKDIVKKYQNNEQHCQIAQNAQNLQKQEEILIEESFCTTFNPRCQNREKCLVCSQEELLLNGSKKSALEIDKGIIC